MVRSLAVISPFNPFEVSAAVGRGASTAGRVVGNSQGALNAAMQDIGQADAAQQGEVARKVCSNSKT